METIIIRHADGRTIIVNADDVEGQAGFAALGFHRDSPAPEPVPAPDEHADDKHDEH